MKSVFITLASIVAISAVVPATAQAKEYTCFYQVDSSRLAGYYGACSEQQLLAAGFGRRSINIIPETPVLTPHDTRDSGGGSGGGGGGGGAR